ncbi:MAG: hypothetical protein D5R99_09590 [Methanocalculus sp. MSAO_Arc1]|uniref:hypothetical protein n=1 Tax=Methanocalculus TaxID=71151 RepID=UPI000FF37997|nr:MULTISPECIES: hypothetical protein [unclassified Methanocalculus]MCP1662745.1 high-affinity Fe2+/Pb2+ permease [Methanocalculus sp. AMF5]RQD78894.1 MAG: hypothetical protein D5R99_09590 [Methanocalculus sp. MSAO_Arc1]
MSLIKFSLIAGAVFYIGLFLIEGTVEPALLSAGIIGSVLLLAVIATLFLRDEEKLKKAEMILLWIICCTFAVYGLLFAGGVL